MRWKLTDLAESQIEKLKADGLEVTPQEVLDIQSLSLEAIGEFEDGTRINGRPVIVGNVALWPLTIAASIWREEVEELLDDADYNSRLFVLAYCMANGHSKEALQTHGKAALKQVYHWAKHLTCSTADLLNAVNEVLGDKPRVTFDDGEETDKDHAAGPSYLAETALAIFGTNPEIWLYQLSIEAVADILAKHYALNQRGNGASKKTVEGLRKLSKYVHDLRVKKNGEN